LQNLERFRLSLHNHESEQEMEATIGFGVLEKCGNTLSRLSNCRCWWSLWGVKVVGRNFENWKIEYVSVNGATTNSAMAKQMVLLDPARRIALGSTSQDFSDCSGDGLWGGENCSGGILKIRKLRIFLQAEPQPAVLLPIGWYHWIQRVEYP